MKRSLRVKFSVGLSHPRLEKRNYESISLNYERHEFHACRRRIIFHYLAFRDCWRLHDDFHSPDEMMGQG